MGWLPSLVGGRPLRVGQFIGLAIHYLTEHDAWSLMGEVMFTADSSGSIAFQLRIGGDVEPAPIGAEGLNLAQLADAIAACSASAESASRRDVVLRTWGPAGRNPAAYYSAWCFQIEEPRAPEECLGDSECLPGELCLNGACNRP